MRALPLALLLLCHPPALAAESELSPEAVARIQRDEKAALARVEAAYGNRPPSQLSQEERRQVVREQQAALEEVYARHQVSSKAFARHTARLGREEREQVDAAHRELEERERTARQAPPEAPEQEPTIQRGISESSPVELEVAPDAPPVVEQGLPAEGEPSPVDVSSPPEP
jgi:hypothetical protein